MSDFSVIYYRDTTFFSRPFTVLKLDPGTQSEQQQQQQKHYHFLRQIIILSDVVEFEEAEVSEKAETESCLMLNGIVA